MSDLLKKAFGIILCIFGFIFSIFNTAMIFYNIDKDKSEIIVYIISLILTGILPIWGGFKMIKNSKKIPSTEKDMDLSSNKNIEEFTITEEVLKPKTRSKRTSTNNEQNNIQEDESLGKTGSFFSQNKDTLKGLFWLICIIMFLVFQIKSCGENDNEKNKTVRKDANPSNSDNIQTQSKYEIPQLQSDFVKIYVKYSSDYNEAINELQKSLLRTKRSKEVSILFSNSKKAENWIGTIVSLSTNTEGKAALEIELLNTDIKIITWNNTLSDWDTNTLIPQDSKLFNSLLNMKEGDTVIFSGRFFADEKDGIIFCNLTELGAMTSPEILMKFESVSIK
ncbi:MAG TPA: hypothetical protein PKJ08_03190 [Candidatus Cloacimonadota bacterium]|nr:hypothetical protein [Candidatus Cloacimonadota bacterium]